MRKAIILTMFLCMGLASCDIPTTPDTEQGGLANVIITKNPTFFTENLVFGYKDGQVENMGIGTAKNVWVKTTLYDPQGVKLMSKSVRPYVIDQTTVTGMREIKEMRAGQRAFFRVEWEWSFVHKIDPGKATFEVTWD